MTVLLPRTEEMINVSFKELKEKKKKRKQEDDEDGISDQERLTGDQISKMEDMELLLIKNLRMSNKNKIQNPDSKYCICQRPAKSVSFKTIVNRFDNTFLEYVPMRALF